MTDERWDRLDNLCPVCGGDRWTVTADPDEFGEPGEPYQIPCTDLLHHAAELARATIRDLVAAARERDKLREALIGLDAAFQWIENEYPKALTAMPSPLFGAFFKARAALHSKDGAS